MKFWERDQQGRLPKLSGAPIYPVRPIEALEQALREIREKGKDVRTFLLEPTDGEKKPQDEKDSTGSQLELALPFEDE